MTANARAGRNAGLLAVLLLLLTGCAQAPAPAEPSPGTSYADLAKSPIRGLSPDQIEAYANGSGFGMALVAELNAYPGPAHVLELGTQLGLSAEQRDEVQAIHDAMKSQARRLGGLVLGAWTELDQAFRDRSVTADEVDAAMREIGELEGELRASHVRAHLDTARVLTHEQTAAYMELRGYGDHAGSAHTH